MADNPYSAVTARLATELQAALAPNYHGLVVSRRLFRPAKLPAFTRYALIVAPSSRPWEERRLGAQRIQYLFRADLFLLVDNWEETDAPLFGTTPGAFGLFQFLGDTKTYLRSTSLGGLLERTYDEPGGDARTLGPGGVDFEEIASPGFDAGEHALVHRAKLPYLARVCPFCHDNTPACVMSG